MGDRYEGRRSDRVLLDPTDTSGISLVLRWSNQCAVVFFWYMEKTVMTLSELLEQTRPLGASASIVNYALQTGRLPPTTLDGAQNRVYGPEHLSALRDYLDAPRPRGRRRRNGEHQG